MKKSSVIEEEAVVESTETTAEETTTPVEATETATTSEFGKEIKKVGIVDVNFIVSRSAQVMALRQEQQARIQDLEVWLQTVRTDVVKQVSPEIRDQLVKKYDAEFAIRREEIAQNYQAKLQMIDRNITATIAEEAKSRGYDLVLSRGIVLFGGDDITAEIAQVVK